MNTYGLRVSLSLILVVAPALLSYLYLGTIDTYPYVITFAAGSAVSAALVLAARRRSARMLSEGTNDPVATFETRQVKWCFCYLGPPLWTFAVALIVNRVLDDSAVSDHATHLLQFVTHQKGSSMVNVESWRYPRQIESLRYDWRTMSEISATTTPRRLLIVSTRSGALGWEWVQRVRPAAQ